MAGDLTAATDDLKRLDGDGFRELFSRFLPAGPSGVEEFRGA